MVRHTTSHNQGRRLLGFGSADLPNIESVFREIGTFEFHDGVAFQPDTVHAAEIRKDANYAGVRVMLLGVIDSARCRIQIDIGFGDAVTPGPEDIEYPIMLAGFAAPKLRAYQRYTVVAEKKDPVASVPAKEPTGNAGFRGRYRRVGHLHATGD